MQCRASWAWANVTYALQLVCGVGGGKTTAAGGGGVADDDDDDDLEEEEDGGGADGADAALLLRPDLLITTFAILPYCPKNSGFLSVDSESHMDGGRETA